MLSLHSVGKMPQKVYQIVVQKMNQTRMDQRGLNGSLDQKPTSVISTTTDLKDPLARILPSYLPYSNDLTTSILSQLRNRVDFWIDFRTILMIVNHLHRLHLSLHSSNWERSAWNLLGWLHPAIHVHRDLVSPVSLPVPPTGRFLSDSQKLLLILMRLRQNLTQEDLAFRFDVEQSAVSRVINQWIPLLAHHLRGLIKWPKTTIGPTDTPYNHMPNTVGIIDGTDIFIQRPSNLATQKSSYSDYKSHTTVKYLVAIDPFTGVFTFVSPGFSRNSSDRW